MKTVLLALTLTFTAACGSRALEQERGASSSEALVGNAVCPISGSPVAGRPDAPTFSVSWRGLRIGMMCPVCVQQFEDATDAERDAWLAKARSSTGR